MREPNPFTGTWTFQPAKSKMNAPGVQHWVQYITVIGDAIRVREDVVSSAGKHADVHLEAKFDGKDYPVAGSSLADAIAYQRVDAHNIRGTGRKNGSVSLRETITLMPDGASMTLAFAIFSGEKEVANGVAVFEKEDAAAAFPTNA
ncbi:MAG TPA: hypothetical protein VE077_09480 [Candidatus Methylomirabilis sp.]|nr:hypothetical protein [Candidatus Methylomirabilis sp.]